LPIFDCLLAATILPSFNCCCYCAGCLTVTRFCDRILQIHTHTRVADFCLFLQQELRAADSDEVVMSVNRNKCSSNKLVIVSDEEGDSAHDTEGGMNYPTCSVSARDHTGADVKFLILKCWMESLLDC